MKFFRTYGLQPRFFYLLGIAAALMALSFRWEVLELPAILVPLGALLLALSDLFWLLLLSKPVSLTRSHAKVLSLKSINHITLEIQNQSPFPLSLEVIDELPYQFQIRNLRFQLKLSGQQQRTLQYELTPVERGQYEFGNSLAWISTILGFWQKRISAENNKMVTVYPSLIHMREMELKANLVVHQQNGIKKVRSIGISYEFEQIKPYVLGDNYRHINWKATGRHGQIMVNHFQEERSKQVYCIIDQGRSMYMPFQGMSLMDYAVNSTLALSNIVIRNEDKAGLLTVGKRTGHFIPAEKRPGQLVRVLEHLYQLDTQQVESNFEELYTRIRGKITNRSLIFLFTNFESIYAMERILPTLRKINKLHLLVVVFFENPVLDELNVKSMRSMRDLYQISIARKASLDKKLLLQQLRQYGIQALLTAPEELSIHSINTYLSLKAMGRV